MREILFRAWDKTRREYLSAGQVLIAVLEGRHPNHSPIHLDFDLKHADLYRERFVLEQFTGLMDKHGKRIFEGDIVEQCTYSLRGKKVEYKRNYAVVFEDGYFGVHAGWGGSLIGIDGVVENVTIEVVGNIHDNQGLLGGAE